MSFVRVISAAGVAFGLAILFYPALTLDRRGRHGSLAVCVTAILVTPFLIAPKFTGLRLLSSVLAIALAAKLYDVNRGAAQGHRPDLKAFLLFLPNLASLVLRKLDAEPRPTRNANLARLARNGLGAALGMVIFLAVFRCDWRRTPFALEHSAKIVALYLVLIPSAEAGVAIWRLLGGHAREPMDHPFAARTPADFWRRYNRPAQQFFYEDVFRSFGALRSPKLAIIATFGVSGIIHEYVFGIALGSVRGYQSAFFLLQGLAVAATAGLKPRGLSAAAWILGTLAYNLASSVLFFANLDEVVPFYAPRASRAWRLW